ncbi:MAG TPA: hypothetical protein VLX91_02255 [Candidatus Acidoferrales bacterium]|nr:hypothetical protein [Candidatus Acidoferrales bacterium]
MKTISLAAVMAAAFCVSSTAFGQSKLAIEVLGGESFNAVNSGGTLSNWGNGWTVGGGLAYHVMPNVDIDFDLCYDRYPYEGGHVELVLPAVAGLRYAVTGKPSIAEEASLGVRFTAATPVVSPFLSVKGGLRNLSTGKIDVAEWFDPTPQDVSHWTYNGTGSSNINFFAAVGFGLLVPINSMVCVSIEGRFTQVFVPNEIFVPLAARVQFNL